MLDIIKKDKEISGNLKNVVSQDNSMKIIESKIAELLNSNVLPDRVLCQDITTFAISIQDIINDG
ncbi:MAG TPA: hypothetical protein VEH06_05605 [Candidatus Bathyarchaeia archaeon]|nr:hypothetical protein [Candidatus Bathyarchaeia archaeon]